MNNNISMVVFSDKAYNDIIRETMEWHPVETGGILLGHILGDVWIVMEVIPPGYGEGGNENSVYHEMGYFEYNKRFVNYMANKVSQQYNIPLQLLGLWHRHPGSMDYFSGTDDVTNRRFASLRSEGAISALVNVDPRLRLTMYHIRHDDIGMNRPAYEKIPIEVGSDIIPEEYFQLRYYDGSDEGLHPFPGEGVVNKHEQTQDQESTQGDEKKPAADSNVKVGMPKKFLQTITQNPRMSILTGIVLGVLLSLSVLVFYNGCKSSSGNDNFPWVVTYDNSIICATDEDSVIVVTDEDSDIVATDEDYVIFWKSPFNDINNKWDGNNRH